MTTHLAIFVLSVLSLARSLQDLFMNTLTALETQKGRYLANTKIRLGCKKNGEGVTILAGTWFRGKLVPDLGMDKESDGAVKSLEIANLLPSFDARLVRLVRKGMPEHFLH